MKSAKTVRLGDVCEVVRERVPVEDTPLARYVTTDSLVKNLGGRAEAEALPPSGSLVAYRKGDLLLSNIRPYLRKLWLADGDGGCSNDIIVLRPCHEINANYLRLLLSQDDFFSYVMRDVSGTKMPRGKREHIMRFSLPLPPLSEQKAIVARLDEALARATRLAEHFTTIAKNADLSFKATLAETFENVSDKEVRLGDVCEVMYGFTAPSSPEASASSVKYLRITDIQNNSINWRKVPYCKCDDLHRYLLKPGDIVFARTGATTGKSFLLSEDFPISVFASYLIRTQIRNKHILSPYYLRYFFDTKEYWAIIKSGMAGTAQGGFNSKKLMALSIPLPSLSEQKTIVARLDAARARCDGIAEQARRGAAAAENLKKALLKEAFE